MAKDKTNIYDVAKKAGVGIATVSRVINDSDKVKAETRDKIIQVMNELDYRPSKVAQNLAKQKSNAVAVILPSFVDHFFVEVLKGIQDSLEKKEVDLILYKIDVDEKRISKIMDIVHSRKVDGIAAITMNISNSNYQELLESEMPVVIADERSKDFHSIYFDNIKGAEMAVDYLFNSGHQKIAFINGDPEHYNAQERFQGVKKAFKKHKLDLDEKYIIESDFYAEDGYQSMQELLEMPRSQWPSAVFAASDNQAIGAIQALEERALKAPDDIALIGYDNIELAKYLKITTIWQPMYKLGQLTIEVLLKAIEGDLKERFEKELDLSLIKRETA